MLESRNNMRLFEFYLIFSMNMQHFENQHKIRLVWIAHYPLSDRSEIFSDSVPRKHLFKMMFLAL